MLRGLVAALTPHTSVRVAVLFCQWCVGFDTMFLRSALASHDGTLASQKKFMLLASCLCLTPQAPDLLI